MLQLQLARPDHSTLHAASLTSRGSEQDEVHGRHSLGGEQPAGRAARHVNEYSAVANWAPSYRPCTACAACPAGLGKADGAPPTRLPCALQAVFERRNSFAAL